MAPGSARPHRPEQHAAHADHGAACGVTASQPLRLSLHVASVNFTRRLNQRYTPRPGAQRKWLYCASHMRTSERLYLVPLVSRWRCVRMHPAQGGGAVSPQWTDTEVLSVITA